MTHHADYACGDPVFTRARTLARARIESRGGTRTARGFVPYLTHPETGIRMPIQVQIRSTGDGQPVAAAPAEPCIHDGVSYWALPGGLTYVSREPVQIV